MKIKKMKRVYRNKYMTRMLTLIHRRKLKVKMIMSYYFFSPRWTKIKKFDNAFYSGGCVETRPLKHC